jgi:hypothetical protein
MFKPIRPDNFYNITDDTNNDLPTRDVSGITHIVLHQTAYVFGDDPTNYKNVNCHVAVTPNGDIIYVNDFKYPVLPDSGFAPHSIDIKIDGEFMGVEGDMSTAYRGGPPPMELGLPQVQGAREAILWAVGELVVRGANPAYLVAHRQGSGARMADPGSAIWGEVACWCLDNLDLKCRFWETVGNGLPIPRQWDIHSLFGWDGKIDKVGIAIIQMVCRIKFNNKLKIDGIVGLKTKRAIAALNESFGLSRVATINNETIECLVNTVEYLAVISRMAELVVEYGIKPHLRGNDLLDIITE